MNVRTKLRKNIDDSDQCIKIIYNLDPNTINIKDAIAVLRISKAKPNDVLAHLALEAELWFKKNYKVLKKRFVE